MAFPSISTGVYHFPIERAARIALTTLRCVHHQCEHVKKLMIVCYSQEDQRVYLDMLSEI